MSDGISDGRRARSIDDIAETGAAWITEGELADLISDLKMFRASHFAKRAALGRCVDAYRNENPARTADMHSDNCACLRCAIDNAETVLR